MPTVPYAKVLASTNGGGTASGGIVVPSAAVMTLTGETTSQWSSQRWEIYGYPPGYTAFAGWSTDGNGVIFSTAVAPPAFTLEAAAARWGKYMLRLTVNGGLTNGKADPTLIDESTSLLMLSPRGQRGLGFNETSQFGGARAQYASELHSTLVAIEGFAGGSGLFPKTMTAAQSYDLLVSEYWSSLFKIVSNGANILRFPPATDATAYMKFVWNASGGGTISVRDTNGVAAAATLASGNGAWFLFANASVKQMGAAFAVA